MNKNDLISVVAEKSGMPKKAAEKAVASVFDAITEALVKGEKVQLVGFGTFEVRERAERVGRIPKSGEEITIPASKAAAFKAGQALKNALN